MTTGARFVLWNPAEKLGISHGRSSKDGTTFIACGPQFYGPSRSAYSSRGGATFQDGRPASAGETARIAAFIRLTDPATDSAEELVADDQFRQAAGYIDLVLMGEKPADLPIQTPTKFERITNLQDCQTLGLQVPSQLLQIADDVTE